MFTFFRRLYGFLGRFEDLLGVAEEHDTKVVARLDEIIRQLHILNEDRELKRLRNGRR